MRLRSALLASLLFSTGAAAPALAQGSAQVSGQEMIVTGIRLPEHRARLAACLARNCPVNEDVDATLAYAEALLLSGEYRDARVAIRQSLSRNRDAAAQYPEPVSDLYRGYARVSRHLGEDRDALVSAHGILNALQAGLPGEDYRTFTARFEIAEMQLRSGRTAGAERELERLAAAARAAGREDVATTAELRRLWYSYIVDPNGDATWRLRDASRDAANPSRANAARVLLARIMRLRGDIEGADRMLADVALANRAQRRLLHFPQYRLARQEIMPDLAEDAAGLARQGNIINRIPENFEGKWIDVGFWVMADGSVSDVEILRQGAPAGWADPLLESLRGRRYTAAAEPTYRMERYTYTAPYEDVRTGSRIRAHSPRVRVEYMDLTEGEGSAPATGGSGGGSAGSGMPVVR